MKTNNPYELSCRVYELCNKEQYFTCGTNTQYDMMFYAASAPQFSVRDIALMIWICSIRADFKKIQKQLEEILKEVDAPEEKEHEEPVYEEG